jgi:hypothetical protein
LPLSTQHRSADVTSGWQQGAGDDDLDGIDYDILCNNGNVQKAEEVDDQRLAVAAAVRSTTLLGGSLPSRSETSSTPVKSDSSRPIANGETPL